MLRLLGVRRYLDERVSSFGGMTPRDENLSTGTKISLPICPPQFPRVLAQGRRRAFEVRERGDKSPETLCGLHSRRICDDDRLAFV